MTSITRTHLPALALLLLSISLLPVGIVAPTHAADVVKPKPDVLVFLNGDRLTGKLDYEADGTVVFKSENAGTVKVPWNKLKSLHTGTPFAVIERGALVGRKKVNPDVPIGTVDIDGGVLTVTTGQLTKRIPVKNIAYLVHRPTFDKNVVQPQHPFQGITGTITAGASTVSSTQNSISINTSINLTRAVPSIDWMPPRQRTLLSFDSTYGRITEPGIPAVKASVLHSLLEQDEYFNPRFYLLQRAVYDHNFSQGLDLQQLYGIGVGYTAIKNSHHQLDITAIVNYVNQQLAASGTTTAVTKNIIGSSFGNQYIHKLPGKIVLTETAGYTPAWNSPKDYTANVAVGVTFPLLKNFGFSAQMLENYLNDPVQGFKGNSLQFNTGLTYTVP